MELSCGMEALGDQLSSFMDDFDKLFPESNTAATTVVNVTNNDIQDIDSSINHK